MTENPNSITCESKASTEIEVIGIAWDDNSTFMKGPAKAPDIIRKTFFNGASNLFAENGVNLETRPFFYAPENMVLNVNDPLASIEAHVDSRLDQNKKVICIGGDHAVTFPVVKAHAKHYDRLNILHFDAHPDLYEIYDKNPYSHACPFARIMENNLADKLVQVGLRTINDHQKDQALRYDIVQFEMKDWKPGIKIHMDGPVYISLDMDVLDPAFAPGVSHHEPGGLSTRHVLGIIQRLKNPVVGADIVEYNPDRDISGITAAAAAKFLKEIAGMMFQP